MTATEILQKLANWSKKYPQGILYRERLASNELFDYWLNHKDE